MIKKIILWLLAIAVALIVILLLAINPILSWSTKKGFNTLAPEITGTATQVGDVEFSVYQGKLEVEDIQVGNPAGFSAPNAFSLDDLVLKLKPSSLLSNMILIEEITLKEPVFVLERSGAKINLVELKKQIDANVKPAATTTTGTEPQIGQPATTQAKKAKKKLAVNKISVADAELQIINQGRVVTLKLADIEIDDFAPQGISSEQLTQKLYETLLPKVLEAAERGVIENLGQNLLNSLGNSINNTNTTNTAK